jgi:DNA (cytosine-5)-methyltransferase 1
MHLGYKAEGFNTVMAIEYNDVAVDTFERNNPGVPTYRGDIREFLKKLEEDESFKNSLGRIDAIHTSSPCQGFSKANRRGGQNDEANNELAYTFPHLLRLTGALIGSFENVEGMWSKKGMPYLKKVLIECIELGYQVRVKIIRCKLQR